MTTITIKEGVIQRKEFKDIAELYDYISEKFLDFKELSIDEVTPEMLKLAQEARETPSDRLHNL